MYDNTKEAYQRILNMLPTIRESITLITRGAANTGSFPGFATSDLEGNPADNTSFAGYKLTMVNIWGTFCGPCIAKMPDLESLSKSMPESTRLIGLITDALDEEHTILAQKNALGKWRDLSELDSRQCIDGLCE
jgi:thiol-disulfide isomerase/thioredoxin